MRAVSKENNGGEKSNDSGEKLKQQEQRREAK